MEIIKQAELNVGWENIKPYISYLEFWKNKTDIELPQDCLFSITAYLGNICGLLNRDIRKKWLNIIGIHIHHEAINTLPEKLIAHVKSFRFGKPICRKKHILSDFEVLGQINFDTDRISKFKNLNAIWFSPPNAFLYFPQYQKEYLKSITELHRLVPHSVALSGINYYIFWDGGFRSRDQKETLHTYVARVFPEMLPEIKERLIMVNNEINTRMTYTEVLKIYDLINNKMGDYILFSDVVQNLETLVENKTLTFRYRDMAGLYEQIKSKEYRDINEFYRDMLKFSVKYGRVIPIGTTDTILDSTPEKINILISYHPVLIEYCNSVIIPVYNNLGIDIEIIIFGVVILTP